MPNHIFRHANKNTSTVPHHHSMEYKAKWAVLWQTNKKNQESFRSFPQEFEIFNQILRLKKDYTQLNYT